MEKAIIIDGNSLIYRLYYASVAMKTKAPNIDIKRQTIKMTYSICFNLVWNKDWDYKIAAFDSKAPLIRKQLLEAYKENRRPMPDDLVNILPTLKEIFDKFGFILFAKNGYEADDLIGSFINLASKHADIECEIYTSDRDLLQLINKNTNVNLFKKGITEIKRYDEKIFEDEFHFNPKLIIDYKALSGDNSDNFPGINGIGPKTANNLLIKYPGGIDDIYSHLDEINKNNKEKLIAGKESCYVCKTIATIDQNLFDEADINLLKSLPIRNDVIENDITALNFEIFKKYFNN